ncbi:surface-adhesin E family protein [Candidatus Nitrospira inopinata]|jgi:hypothetical protein|uniref:Surface-adhesin protein E-like domain-containing protein n=1 Tax=Candidatus Nitrospira inopinata TaxID=1715989 RepID=A0A0S4KYJ7_9BACT|nr:surface-adhesin E family protein [Candidatus Nitrospira inopinata]CUQ66754.1 exported protein of unknown function [Candidatus Nitrospira inopinata]
MNVRLASLIGLLLPAVLTLHGSPAWGGWIALDKRHQPQSKQVVHYDPDTIHREGNVVTVWQLMDVQWMGESPTPRFLSATTHKQFDCRLWRVRVLQVVEFSRNMATGKSRSGYIENANWRPIEPQSVDHGLGEIVCRKP